MLGVAFLLVSATSRCALGSAGVRTRHCASLGWCLALESTQPTTSNKTRLDWSRNRASVRASIVALEGVGVGR